MLENVVIVYKKLGQTPLECLNELKILHPEWTDLPMTYAGRLDPMAEGLMIVLIGEECKNKDKYLKLDKTYEFQVLVGFETDTYDLLGLVASSSGKIFGPRVGSPDAKILPDDSAQESQTVSKEAFDFALESFTGTFIQKYPTFSSKTVDGKQLFQLSRDDELPSKLPEHEVTIKHFQCTSTVIQGKNELDKEIRRRIALVKGDFRQEEIIKKWAEAFKNNNQEEYTIFSCVADCSSGTYVRQLVADIGEKLGMPLVTYSIKRTKVGEYQ